MSRYLVRAHGTALLATLVAVFAFDVLLGQPQGTAERLLIAGIAFCALGGWRSARREADENMELLRATENRAAREFSASLARRTAELSESACTCGRCHPGETNDRGHPALPVMASVLLLSEHIETPDIRNVRSLRATMPEGAPWHTAS